MAQLKDKRKKKRNWSEMSYEELLPHMQPRQIRFAEELERGGTLAQAYIRAGYSPKGAESASSTLHNDAKFAAFRKARTAWLYEKEGITKEWIGRERLKLYRDAMGEAPLGVYDERQMQMVPDSEWARDPKLAAELLKQMSADLQDGIRGGVQVSITVPGGTSDLEEWSK